MRKLARENRAVLLEYGLSGRILLDWYWFGGCFFDWVDNTKESLILFEVTLELHCGHDWNVCGFDITLDEDIRVDTDGVRGEIDNGSWNGSCEPALAYDGFESGLDDIELDNRLEVVGQLQADVTITGTGDGLTTTKSNHNWFFFLGRGNTK